MRATPETVVVADAVPGVWQGDIGAAAPKDRDFHLRRLLAGADCAAIALGATVTAVLTASPGAGVDRVVWTLVTLPAWIALFKVYGLYDRDSKRVSYTTVDDIPWIFHALLVGTVALWMFYKLVPVQEPSFWQSGLMFLVSFAAILATRATARVIGRATTPSERMLFIGSGSSAALLEKKMRSHPEYRLEAIGYLTVGDDEDGTDLEMPCLGSIDDLESVCHLSAVDRVLLVSAGMSEEILTSAIRRLRDVEVRISLLPQVVGALGPSLEIDDVEGVTVLGVNSAVLTRSSVLLKRGVDMIIAVPVLLLTLPLMATIAIAIKLDSRGPVFYRQERVGRGGSRFRIFKFRTMTRDAEAHATDLWATSRHEAWLLVDHDPRITRVGRLLRHSSLDELPQLLNVIGGSMSLVGPRPMTPDVDRHISGWGRRRLDLTPGITGLWQVLGRTNIAFEEMVKLDYLYVTNWSLWEDIRLLVKTLPAVISRRGAN